MLVEVCGAGEFDGDRDGDEEQVKSGRKSEHYG